MGFPGGSDGKDSACNAGDPDSIPGLGRSPGEGNGNPLQPPAWRIPWTEEPGGLHLRGRRGADTVERLPRRYTNRSGSAAAADCLWVEGQV